jgi:hypothetical protein
MFYFLSIEIKSFFPCTVPFPPPPVLAAVHLGAQTAVSIKEWQHQVALGLVTSNKAQIS